MSGARRSIDVTAGGGHFGTVDPEGRGVVISRGAGQRATDVFDRRYDRRITPSVLPIGQAAHIRRRGISLQPSFVA